MSTIMSIISILLVDDHALMLDTLAERLGSEEGLEVIGLAPNADEGVRVALKCRPDVIVLDINMQGLCPFEAARKLLAQLPESRVVFLSGYTTDSYIGQALACGASAYITKREPYERMVQAIRVVAEGDAYFSPEVQSRIVVGPDGASLVPIQTLTKREIEVLGYLARGMSKKKIAQTMYVSVHTVDVHTSHIMKKLDIHDRVELALYAIREGLVPLS
jgi:DNA-binding NarL/FixJ family response regulator